MKTCDCFGKGKVCQHCERMNSDGYKAIYGCGESKEDIDNKICWRQRLCKDCTNLRLKQESNK